MDRPGNAHVEPGLLVDFSPERCFKTLTRFEATPRQVPEAGVEG
jgi:hypothetical protein